ncbi:MAG: TIGR03013 family PEP-CTERM/XrtA system glycosyltransferase [Geobacteraceae bacterium]|nr:TIGR03013 family PEP-CTERM/XrtA system glycosyltransferase [Geobacteraceae bacterium]
MNFKLKTLIVGDIFFAAISFYLALNFRFGFDLAHNELHSLPVIRVILFTIVLITVAYIFDVYNVSKKKNRFDVFNKILQSNCVGFFVLSALFFLNPEWMIGRGLLAITLTLFISFQFAWHIIFRSVFGMPYLSEHIIIVGTGCDADIVAMMIEAAEGVNHKLEGFIVSDDCSEDTVVVPHEKILGEMEQLLEIITKVSATKIIITTPSYMNNPFFQNLLLNSKLLGVEISDVPTYFESVSEKLMLEKIDMNSMIYSNGFKCSRTVLIVKRFIDIAVSLTGIFLTLPLFPIFILLVKLNSPGPVFYRQVRVGRLGSHFTLYKFRTMDVDAEIGTGAVWAAENDGRIKPIARFMRKSRLDELPQLYNVLIGNMSFIGPRPERPEFVRKLQELIPFYSKRHFLKPGLTGWAQIKHPYGASVEESFEKLRYDLYYFKNMNLMLDTVILLKTIRVIFSQFGGR